MADGKKSVLLYCDLITTVEKLKDGDAGKLFKHFLRYVNDLNPQSPNQLIEIVFEPIKQQLKRDLKKWENKSKKNSDNANKRWEEVRNNANASERIKPDAKNADTVNDTVTVTVTDTVNDIKNYINIGIQKIEKSPSEYLVENDTQYYESRMMTVFTGMDKKEILKQFDEKYNMYNFNDINHLRNSFVLVGSTIKKEKGSVKKESKITGVINSTKDALQILKDRNEAAKI